MDCGGDCVVSREIFGATSAKRDKCALKLNRGFLWRYGKGFCGELQAAAPTHYAPV